MIIDSKKTLEKHRKDSKEVIKSFSCRILVCSGTGCIATGSEKIYERMKELCGDLEGVVVEMQREIPHIGVVKSGCQGICELGPLMKIEPYNFQYVKVQLED